MIPLGHRHAIALPFVLLIVVVATGGLLNSVDVRARIIDELTLRGVKDALISHGVRRTATDENGDFVLTGVPRTSKMSIKARGYQVTSAPPTADEIRLQALSVTLYVRDSTKEAPDNSVPNPQARRDDRILAMGASNGQIIIAPHPGRSARLLVCATGYRSREIVVEGVLMELTLDPEEGGACPPLPTASPDPNATPSLSGEPSPSPEPESSASPSPTSSP